MLLICMRCGLLIITRYPSLEVTPTALETSHRVVLSYFNLIRQRPPVVNAFTSYHADYISQD